MKERITCFISCGPNRITRCGIGPRFSIMTVLCGISAGWLTFQYPTVFRIHGIPPWIFVVLGSVLVVVGTIVYMIALRTFNEAYRCKRLVTHGLYAYVRHPIYLGHFILMSGVIT